ncbi:MAG: glycosyltransferase family 9 protein [Pseudobutyrivibrio sp.]|nr:glycosyltransferase family 9 protein [Pseudobutyrivibrio sp.]
MGTICDKLTADLLLFCGNHKHIYLYGAGIYAGRYRLLLEKLGQNVRGCFVSDGQHDERQSISVIPFFSGKKLLEHEDGIILALSEDKHSDVLDLLNEVENDVWRVSNETINFLYNEVVLLPIFRNIATSCNYSMISLSDFNRILIIRTDVLGDLLMTIPFLRELKRNAPNAEIDMVIRDSNKFLMCNCPYISHLITFSPNNTDEIDLARLKKFSKLNFSNKNYDVVFLPRVMLVGRNYAENDILGMLCGAKYRIGRLLAYSDDSNDSSKQEELYKLLQPFFTKLFWQAEPRHEVEYMLEIVKGCGGNIEDDRLEYWLTDASKKFADECWNAHNIPAQAVCLTIGLVSKSPNRTWSAEHYAEFCRIMHNYDRNLFFILIGGEDAKKHAKRLSDYNNVIDLTGKTQVDQAAACIAKCKIYVGANTGLMHLAAALHKPVVEISAWLPDGSPLHGIAPLRMGAWGVPMRLCQPKKGKDDCRGACNKSYAHCINDISAGLVARNVISLIESM